MERAKKVYGGSQALTFPKKKEESNRHALTFTIFAVQFTFFPNPKTESSWLTK